MAHPDNTVNRQYHIENDTIVQVLLILIVNTNNPFYLLEITNNEIQGKCFRYYFAILITKRYIECL